MIAKFIRNGTSAVVATVGIVLWLGAAHTAAAQPSDEQAQAEYSKGVDLFNQHKFAEACLAFEASRKHSSRPKTLVNLALCRRQIGQLAAAWRLLRDVERLTRDKADSDEKEKEIHEKALKNANEIEEEMSKLTMSKLTIEVPAESLIHGLDIWLGTDPVDPETWNRALPIDGGTYTITARAPGATPWTIKVKVGPKADNRVVEIPRLVTSVSLAVDGPVVSVTGGSVQRRTRSLPFAFAGGGALLLGGAAGFYLWALSSYYDAKNEMVNQARRDSLESSANARRHIALGMGVAGLACGGVAAWLYVTGRATAASTTATSRARVRVVPSVGGATGTGLMVLGGF